MPRETVNDPNTLSYVRQRLPQEVQRDREFFHLSDRQSLGGWSGHADGREGREFVQGLVEATGIPSWARGIEDLRYNNPGDALPEIAMGGLQTGSLIALPFDAAAAVRAPRVPIGYRPPLRLPPQLPPRLPQMPPPNPVIDMAGLGRTASRGFDEADSDFFARMASDEMPTPEEALGRPLTPDHIWNDPRFAHRLSITSDLEGIKTPEERFHIAGERIAATRQRSGANDLDEWRGDRAEMLPDLIRRERSIDGSYGGEPVSNPMTMDSIIEMGTDPALAPHYDEFAQGYLGHFGAGRSGQHEPLLGTPDIAADPMAMPRRPGFGSRPPQRQGPNEDRYLFGRLPRQPEAASMRPQQAPDAGSGGAGQIARDVNTPNERTYNSSNTTVMIERQPGDDAFSVSWMLRGQRPEALSARANVEREGIEAAIQAIRTDAASNPSATYQFQGTHGPLIRRYRRMAEQAASDAGFTVSEQNGTLFLRRIEDNSGVQDQILVFPNADGAFPHVRPRFGRAPAAPSTGTPPKSYKDLPRRTPPRPRPPQRPMR